MPIFYLYPNTRRSENIFKYYSQHDLLRYDQQAELAQKVTNTASDKNCKLTPQTVADKHFPDETLNCISRYGLICRAFSRLTAAAADNNWPEARLKTSTND